MSELHSSDYAVLLRAGFTAREIAAQKRKFVNLTTIEPCLVGEKRQFDKLVSDRRALLDALKATAIELHGCQTIIRQTGGFDLTILQGAQAALESASAVITRVGENV